MRVAFVNPPFKSEQGRFSRASRSPAITRSGTLYYPIWLAYACGWMERCGHEALLLDCCAEGLTLEAASARLESFAPELVAVDASTPSIAEDVRSAARFKALGSHPKVCLVGSHPSALPEETLALEPRIDCIALREYDQTLVDLAECLEAGGDPAQVAGLCLRRDGAPQRTAARGYLEDLDRLPFVSQVYQKHLCLENYFFAAGEYPMAMIMTGRGCPSHCWFCVYPQTFHGHKYRLRSAENVADEFAFIVRELPQVKSVGIEDDTFTADLARVRAICQLLIERGIDKKLRWWANTRVSLDLETMRLMKRAGCRLVIPGFESGDQNLLNQMRKGVTLEQSRRFAASAKSAGLLVHGCFMVGNRGETRQTMESTLAFACGVNPDTAQFFPMIPYPGTEAFRWARENGFLAKPDYAQWLTSEGLHAGVVDLPGLTGDEMLAFCDQARRRFYLRPRYLARKLLQVCLSSRERKRTLKSLAQFRKFLLRAPRREGRGSDEAAGLDHHAGL